MRLVRKNKRGDSLVLEGYKGGINQETKHTPLLVEATVSPKCLS